MVIKEKYNILNQWVIIIQFLVFLSVPVLIRTAEAGNILSLIIPAVLNGAAHGSPGPDLPPADGDHTDIKVWKGTATCLQCHKTEGVEVFNSVHYQWLGDTPYMTDGPARQGKIDVGVNSYCINTTGNWNGCGTCHAGLGARPETTLSTRQLENIDCLVCHQDKYKRKKVNGVFVPDTAKMTISMVEAARTVHLPTRISCLQCHAKGGGGDNFKRGDMALAHGTTADKNFDVHMATTGENLKCQDCHITQKHRMAGKGSDLRPTDLDLEMSCTQCHKDKATVNGHDDKDVGRHVARVACQTCHIATYARDAADTAASEKTEIHRDWLQPHVTATGAIHPTPTMAGNLVPKYKWWNGLSTNYLLFDKIVVDPVTGRIPTSRPRGAVDDQNAKLYPFKYKTALQPLATNRDELIALDTSVYFGSGDASGATVKGLENMGYNAAEPYEWIETDTYQLISHEVSPASRALDCSSCHNSSQRMDLQGELGYQLKGPQAQVCTQCHEKEDSKGFEWIHKKHVKDKKYDCSLCHTFSRPERHLKMSE
ncbi:MAG: hypothetical protein DSY58_07540 [Desulfobulbus sp.]|nr:MAG: hypothetical protein DSY58_07540 [Desulfobulbus sp.]